MSSLHLIYTRSSASDGNCEKAKLKGSLRRQEKSCRSLVAQLGGSVVGVITDEASAAGPFFTPGIACITELVAAGLLGVLVVAVDTLAYLVSDHDEYHWWLENVLQPAGVKLVAACRTSDGDIFDLWIDDAVADPEVENGERNADSGPGGEE